MNTITATDNGAIAFRWSNIPGVSLYEQKGKSNLCELFNMTRGASEIDVLEKLPVVWRYDNVAYVALMFYMRNIRKNPAGETVPKGKGERDLSYYMALWLLQNNEEMFVLNHSRFVRDIGYFKDCLNLAKMAKERHYSDQKIELILLPMVIALMDDENKIIQKTLKHVGDRTKLELSLASKWAPRQGKAFSDFIPVLKKMCNLTGKKSDEKWRKYIRGIAQGKPNSHTIENSLSSKQYDKINFSEIPSKSFNLYKTTFMRIPELSEKYCEFINTVRSGHTKIHVNTSYPHEILTPYINTENLCMYSFGASFYGYKLPLEDTATEAQWKCFMDTVHNNCLSLDRVEYNFIPMIDISGSMFEGKELPIKVALTLSIIMSQINTGIFKRKAITFSSIPLMYDILGDTLHTQISSIFNTLYKPENECEIMFNTNFVAAFDCLLKWCLENAVPPHVLKKTKVIAFSDMEFDMAQNSWGSNVLPLDSIRAKFAKHYYEMPQLIFWNLNGDMKHTPCQFDESGVACLSGFEPSIIDEFLDSGELDPSSIPFQIIKEYKKLVILPDE